jgi:hypothetical protein
MNIDYYIDLLYDDKGTKNSNRKKMNDATGKSVGNNFKVNNSTLNRTSQSSCLDNGIYHYNNDENDNYNDDVILDLQLDRIGEESETEN